MCSLKLCGLITGMTNTISLYGILLMITSTTKLSVWGLMHAVKQDAGISLIILQKYVNSTVFGSIPLAT